MDSMDSKQIKKLVTLLIIFAIVWQVYNYTYRAKHGDYLSQIKIADVPESIKCAFNDPGCEEANIDGWALVHALMYFIIGLIVPGYYLLIIAISLLFEISQPYFGNKARYVVNPLINITSYTIGSLLSNKIF